MYKTILKLALVFYVGLSYKEDTRTGEGGLPIALFLLSSFVFCSAVVAIYFVLCQSEIVNIDVEVCCGHNTK